MRNIVLNTVLLCLSLAVYVSANNLQVGQREEGDVLVTNRIIYKPPIPFVIMTARIGAHAPGHITFVNVTNAPGYDSTFAIIKGGVGNTSVLVAAIGERGRGLRVRFQVYGTLNDTTPVPTEPSTTMTTEEPTATSTTGETSNTSEAPVTTEESTPSEASTVEEASTVGETTPPEASTPEVWSTTQEETDGPSTGGTPVETSPAAEISTPSEPSSTPSAVYTTDAPENTSSEPSTPDVTTSGPTVTTDESSESTTENQNSGEQPAASEDSFPPLFRML